jgi:hypothetical protein
MTTTRVLVIAGLVFGTSLIASAAGAQSTPTTPASARWAPWLGCWQVSEESVQDGAALLAELMGTSSAPASARPAALVCVTLDGDAGATMTTIVNDKPLLTETIVADGARKPLTDPGCKGWQKAEWSPLGARLYAQAEIACDEQPSRTVSGMAVMVAGPMWLDIQMIESDGRKSLRVRRYRRSADQKHAGTIAPALRQTAAMPLGGKLTLADIKEASTRVAPEALQAAVMELGAGGYELNARRLLDLDAAGVPDSVIDLMVAMSFPKRFIVERSGGGGGGFSDFWGSSGYDNIWPLYSDPLFYTSYYAPFGYRYWGRYDPYYFQGPGFVVLNPGGGTPGAIEPSGDGRVVDGRGYTRIRRNEPEVMTRGTDGSMGAADSNRGSSAGSSSSGNSGASPSGYSGGGSSGSDRTAQPRPPGGR